MGFNDLIFESVSILLRHLYRHEFDGILDLFNGVRNTVPSKMPLEN
ncbi:integrase [Aggregatibacter aphrophilus NJ8700]|nr:integrase [Aggregatibacter aphrophilus NJ8700]